MGDSIVKHRNLEPRRGNRERGSERRGRGVGGREALGSTGGGVLGRVKAQNCSGGTALSLSHEEGRGQGRESQGRGEDGALSPAFVTPAPPGRGDPGLDTCLDGG